MAAYVGAQMLIEAIGAAGSVDMEKVRAAAAKMDKPAKSYATGFGAKFDAKFQNTRAFPIGGAVAVGQDRHGVPEGSRAAEREARQPAAQVTA